MPVMEARRVCFEAPVDVVKSGSYTMTSTTAVECSRSVQMKNISNPAMFPAYFSRASFCALLLILLPLIGCGDNRQDSMDESPSDSAETSIGRQLTSPYDYEGLARFRAEKDRAFRGPDTVRKGGVILDITGSPTPIPDTLLKTFSGLHYYPPDSSFVFEVSLRRLPSPKPVTLMTSTGVPRPMLRYGTFTFPIDGKQYTLTAFKSREKDPHLFVPFKDATNSGETYGAGRYLDLDEHSGDSGYVLDFNLAYNPYCAYNSDYSCPIVPSENALPVAIPAGEKQLPETAH